MMMRRIGMIGAGNMGGAILHGVMDADYVKASQLLVYDVSRVRLEELALELPGVSFCDTAVDLAEQSDVIILAVKPHMIRQVIDDIRPLLNGKAIISIAAGWTVAMLRDALDGTGATYLRVMPNTPAMVGEGMTAICNDTTFSGSDFDFAQGIFDALGRTIVLPEHLFDGVVAISGSSPAYVYIMIEAMADAGVREGISRKDAYEMAAQAVLGSALMVLQSGDHPASLKDAVCSPGGTTIDAVAALERGGFRAAIMEAMAACAQKSREMSEKGSN